MLFYFIFYICLTAAPIQSYRRVDKVCETFREVVDVSGVARINNTNNNELLLERNDG